MLRELIVTVNGLQSPGPNELHCLALKELVDVTFENLENLFHPHSKIPAH